MKNAFRLIQESVFHKFLHSCLMDLSRQAAFEIRQTISQNRHYRT